MEVSGMASSSGRPDASVGAHAVVVRPLWLLLAILFSLQVLLRLAPQSMFFDGMIYSTIARNMSEGIGTIWRPYFSKTLFPLFAEHPPLLMWLEAIIFRAFGDSILVEKIVSLLTVLASGGILLATWRLLNEDDAQFRSVGALPLILALAAGRVGWAFANNMLENLLIVFTSLAIYMVIKAYGVSGLRSRLVLVAAAGLATALAVLTKGPVGLFPIAAPAIFWLAFRRPRLLDVIADTVIIIAVTVAVFAILWQFEEARGYINRYLVNQLLPSLQGQRGAASGGWKALITLLRVNFYPVLIAGILFLLARYLRQERFETPEAAAIQVSERTRRGVFLLMVGLSASLPLLASPRVSSFYFNPSLLYFSSAVAIWCAPVVLRTLGGLDDRRRRRFTGLLCLVLAGSLIAVGANAGRPGIDRLQIEDAGKIAQAICPNAGQCRDTVAVCDAVWQDWQLHAYMERYYKISLATAGDDSGDYLIANGDCISKSLSDGYSEVGIGLSEYKLLRR